MSKKESGQITIKIRRTTKSRLEKELAEYIGSTGKAISMSEYIDLLRKPKGKKR